MLGGKGGEEMFIRDMRMRVLYWFLGYNDDEWIFIYLKERHVVLYI